MKVFRPNFEKRDGLVTVVTQDAITRQILMVAFTNEAGYLETLANGRAVYWSTSRNERWCKGETSGDIQVVKGVLVDCDGDALIYLVEQKGGGACHTKAPSCFYRSVGAERELLSPAPGAGDKEKLQVMETDVIGSLAVQLIHDGR
jgi:phosphoribosyl-AMP cyclohydrolase